MTDTKEKTGPYKMCMTSKDDVPFVYGIDGPGNGLGYYSWYLYPENTFETTEEAIKVARLMNMAFVEGQRHRSKQVRELLE